MDTLLNLFPDDTILTNAQPKLVAFAGRAGSGKSLASDTLVARGYKRIKFADGLKNMLRSLYATMGLTTLEIERRIEGDLKEEPDPLLNSNTPRWAMQSLGEEWGRKCMHQNLWKSITATAIKNAMKAGYNVVVDDCRYENEAAFIRGSAGRVIMIDRVQAISFEDLHESEKFPFSPDVTIYNTGTPEQLVDDVLRVCP
jgi:hypothetical protein